MNRNDQYIIAKTCGHRILIRFLHERHTGFNPEDMQITIFVSSVNPEYKTSVKTFERTAHFLRSSEYKIDLLNKFLLPALYEGLQMMDDEPYWVGMRVSYMIRTNGVFYNQACVYDTL